MDVRKQLAADGESRRKMIATVRFVNARLRDRIKAAHAEGVPIAEIARLAQVTRVTVYAALKRDH